MTARALLAGAALLMAGAAAAQTRPAAPAARASAPALPVPDQTATLKMVWSVMAAVDQANRTGNYSVLRDLGTPAFQQNNNPASLGAAFASLRDRRVDLSDTLIATPVFDIGPAMVAPTTLRMRGAFPLRPSTILFDLLFSWDRGGWRLEGVAVQAQPAPPGGR